MKVPDANNTKMKDFITICIYVYLHQIKKGSETKSKLYMKSKF